MLNLNNLTHEQILAIADAALLLHRNSREGETTATTEAMVAGAMALGLICRLHNRPDDDQAINDYLERIVKAANANA